MQSLLQAIAMDEDAELAGLSDQAGLRASGGGAIPAGSMLSSAGDQTQRKVPLEREPDTRQALGRTSQDPPLLPHAPSGVLSHAASDQCSQLHATSDQCTRLHAPSCIACCNTSPGVSQAKTLGTPCALGDLTLSPCVRSWACMCSALTALTSAHH